MQARLLALLGVIASLSPAHLVAVGLDDWFPRDSDTTNDLQAIAFGRGTFVAVGRHGSVLTSADGVSWRSLPAPATNHLNAVASGAENFVAAGDGLILVSSNLTDWSASRCGLLSGRGFAASDLVWRARSNV